KDINNNVEK
nr:Chain B, Nitric oxide synthase, inducible [Homo sapiens]